MFTPSASRGGVVEPEQDSGASLARPFYLTILPTGEMTWFAFAKDVPPEVRILLAGLTSSLQLVAPSLPLEGWRMTEQDVSGEYEAACRVSAGVVHKTKVTMHEARVLGSTRTTAKLASLESRPELAGGMRGAEYESDALSDAAAGALAKKQANRGGPATTTRGWPEPAPSSSRPLGLSALFPLALRML